MSAVDELFENHTGRTGRGCRVCGAPIVVAFGTELRKVHPNGRIKVGKGGSISKTWSLCDEHGAAIFQQAVALMEGML